MNSLARGFYKALSESLVGFHVIAFTPLVPGLDEDDILIGRPGLASVEYLLTQVHPLLWGRVMKDDTAVITSGGMVETGNKTGPYPFGRIK